MTVYEHTPHPHVPRNINKVHAAEQAVAGFNMRLAVLITKGFGTMTAFYVLLGWMFLWMALASAGVWLFKLDSYPFPFLLFCSNIVQLVALPVLAVGQQVLSRKQELQAEEQFHDVVAILHDIEQIMQHLDAQDTEILRLVQQQTDLLAEIQQLNKQIAQATNRESA